MSNTQNKRRFRNSIDVESIEGIEVESGSLWTENDSGLLVLVDDDQYASCKLDESIFRIEE